MESLNGISGHELIAKDGQDKPSGKPNLELIGVYKMEARYKIGQTFKTRHKNPKFCTVRDIHFTIDSAGNLVKTRYVTTHSLMGQIVTDYDVPESTITMGLESTVQPQG